MIPKIIHYCWFGHGKIPKLGKKCIASWQEFFPDYEIKEWNESNFNVNIIPYTAEAYAANKYAFVSDYARFWILYHYGGIYFDTDVEVIRPMDDMIKQGPFMGAETSVTRGERLYINPGIGICASANHSFIKQCMEYYESIEFSYSKGKWTKTVCEHITGLLDKQGLKQTDSIQHICGFTIYPWDYMCPISTIGLVTRKTENTVCIHHFAASWSTPLKRLKKRIARLVGPSITMMIINLKNQYKHLLSKK